MVFFLNMFARGANLSPCESQFFCSFRHMLHLCRICCAFSTLCCFFFKYVTFFLNKLSFSPVFAVFRRTAFFQKMLHFPQIRCTFILRPHAAFFFFCRFFPNYVASAIFTLCLTCCIFFPPLLRFPQKMLHFLTKSCISSKYPVPSSTRDIFFMLRDTFIVYR